MLGQNSHPPFIAAARVANFNRHISAYAKDVETSYEAMKMEKVAERMRMISTAIEFQTRVATEVNEMNKEKMSEFGDKLKDLCARAEARYNARSFKDSAPAQPTPAPIIDLTAPTTTYT